MCELNALTFCNNCARVWGYLTGPCCVEIWPESFKLEAFMAVGNQVYRKKVHRLGGRKGCGYFLFSICDFLFSISLFGSGSV